MSVGSAAMSTGVRSVCAACVARTSAKEHDVADRTLVCWGEGRLTRESMRDVVLAMLLAEAEGGF
jgi:glycerate kinase